MSPGGGLIPPGGFRRRFYHVAASGYTGVCNLTGVLVTQIAA